MNLCLKHHPWQAVAQIALNVTLKHKKLFHFLGAKYHRPVHRSIYTTYFSGLNIPIQPSSSLDLCSKALVSQGGVPLSLTEKLSPSYQGSSSSSNHGMFFEDSVLRVPTGHTPTCSHTHTHTPYHTNAIFKDSCQERTSIHCSNKYPPNLNGFTQQKITPCSVLYRAGQHPRL